jgi:hypothetical protein
MGRVVSGSGRVMSGCRVRFGRVSGFSYNFRVASGYFLNSGENFGPRLTRRMIGSGRFFSGGSDRVYRVGQPMIRYTWSQLAGS